MKPVLILQNLSADGPAYLAQWLRREGVAFDLRNVEAGAEAPHDLHAHGALALLGGEMSANDDLPSLRRAESLVRQALERGIPVIGHCLGGQLMARAMGARVVDSPAPEIGWQPLEVLDPPDDPEARGWFGEPGPRQVFQWHFESFELPPAATRLAGSAACPNQAFAVGPHLAMQFHVEVDAEKLGRWVRDDGERYLHALARHASVQSKAAMVQGTRVHLAAQQALADRLYARWLSFA